MLDIAIRNGRVVDGSGRPAYQGDVGINDGTIVSVGQSAASAQVEVDADGLVVAPGFVDPHTHFDAQLLFDPFATPLMEHGVTSVVTGNCSLSLAPLRANQREMFSAMFRLIEEMPEATFDHGVDWRWGEDFGPLLDALRADLAMNVAPLVGHSVLRLYVMGPDAQQRAATADEVAAMCDLLRRCLDEGAVGMSTSYVDIDPDFRPVPSRWAVHDELDRLCAVLGERGRMLQVVPEFYDPGLMVTRVDILADLSLRHGIPATFSPLFHTDAMPHGTEVVMDAVDRVWANGARVWPQVQTRPIDISFTLAQRSIMFLTIPGWWAVMSLREHADKVAAFRDPTTRSRLVDAVNAIDAVPRRRADPGSIIVRDVVHDRNRDLVGRTLGDIAGERGTTPGDVLVDIALDEDLGTWFIRADVGHTNTAAVGELLAHPLVHVGASDAGAHIGTFATYGDTGHLFSQYVRGTGHLTLEGAVKKVTHDPCAIWGLDRRGLLEAGYAADVVVFDDSCIDRDREELADDLPGGIRWIRRSVGVDTVMVNGAITWTQGNGYTDARTGAVVSG